MKSHQPVRYPLAEKIAARAAGLMKADPALRAAAAVQLFGKENAALALEELSPAFVSASTAITKYGLVLDSTSRREIYQFRQGFVDLKAAITDFAGLRGWWESFKQGAEIIAAAAENMARRANHSLDELFFKYVPGVQALRGLFSGTVGAQPPQPGDVPRQQQKDVALLGSAADGIIAEANAAKARNDQTFAGQTAIFEAEKAKASSLYGKLAADDEARRINPNSPGLLSPQERFNFAIQQQSAAQLSKRVGDHVSELKSAEDLQKLIDRKTADSRIASQEFLQRAKINPESARDLHGELEKLSTFRDGDNNIHRITLDNQTRRDLETGFHLFADDLNLKAAQKNLKVEEESFQKRLKFEGEIFEKRLAYQVQTGELEVATDAKGYARQTTLAGYDRDAKLGALGLQHPQTVAEKLGFEQAKLGIEKDYLLEAAKNEADRVTRDRNRLLTDAARELDLKRITPQMYSDRARAIEGSSAAEGTAISDKYTHDTTGADQQAQIAQLEIVRQSQLKLFDNLKQSASGLFDALISHTRSFGDALKATIKSAILTPIKEILASQTAALLTQLLTGHKVTFGGVGTGQGTFGKLGDVLGRAGLGQPKFSSSKLEQANHIGDMSLVRGAVPVVIVGQSQQSGGGYSPFGVGALASLTAKIGPMLAVAGQFPQRSLIRRAATATDEAIKYDGDNAFSSLGGSSISASGGVGGYGGLGADGLPVRGMSGTDLAANFPGSSIIGGGWKAGLKGLTGNLNQFLGGAFHPGNTVGLAGNLSQLAKSPAGLLAGGALAFDGLRRGGFKGLLESTAGGALIGNKILPGGIGALVGAGVGAIAGTIRLFVKGGREKIKDEVHKVYGIKISDGIADQIQQIAKQSYGGDWRVAIRSQQVRELIRLYSQTIGSDAQKQFVGDTVHAASLSQSGGRLTQNAIYDNGQAYSYQSPLDVNGGIETSNLSTSARGSGSPIMVGHLSLSLNGQSAADALAGQVTKVATPGFVAQAAVSGYARSSGRAANSAMALAPSVVQQ